MTFPFPTRGSLAMPSLTRGVTAGGHAVALSRYERCHTGHVLAVNCPMKCLLKFVEIQNRMNEVEAEGEHDVPVADAHPAAPAQDAVAKAVDAAGTLEPGLQELYAKKFGKSIQEDIMDAAASAPNGVGKNVPASSSPSPAAQAKLAALSAELVRYWEDHAVTHGEEASGGGRELFRSDLPANNVVPLAAGVKLYPAPYVP